MSQAPAYSSNENRKKPQQSTQSVKNEWLTWSNVGIGTTLGAVSLLVCAIAKNKWQFHPPVEEASLTLQPIDVNFVLHNSHIGTPISMGVNTIQKINQPEEVDVDMPLLFKGMIAIYETARDKYLNTVDQLKENYAMGITNSGSVIALFGGIKRSIPYVQEFITLSKLNIKLPNNPDLPRLKKRALRIAETALWTGAITYGTTGTLLGLIPLAVYDCAIKTDGYCKTRIVNPLQKFYTDMRASQD